MLQYISKFRIISSMVIILFRDSSGVWCDENLSKGEAIIQIENLGVPVQETIISQHNFKCGRCGIQQQDYENLIKHCRLHFRGAVCTCELCGKEFGSKTHLKFHVRAHIQDKPHSCVECGKSFIGKQRLKNHMRCHSDERCHECNTCGTKFKTLGSMNYHKKQIHEGWNTLKKHECAFCKKRFKYPLLLSEHIRIHTGEEPYPCDLCGKRFRSDYKLAAHMKSHSTLRPHSCRKCGKTFRTVYGLKSHEVVHNHEKMFSCSCCEKRFSHKCSVDRHLKTCCKLGE